MSENEEIIENIKKSSKTKSQFIARVKDYLGQQNELDNIIDIINILFGQNFDLKEFDLSDENSATSLVRQLLNKPGTTSDLGTSVWSYFRNHSYLMQDPEPEMPKPLIGEEAKVFSE